MKKHIALGICVLIFLIIGGCSFIMPQSGENGYNHFWGNGDSFRGVFTYYKDGEESPVTEEVTVNFSKVKGYGEGILYAMTLEEMSEKQFPDYVLERLPVYLYVQEDKIYRIFLAVLSEEDAKEIEGEAQLFSDERIGTMVVCQEQEKEETVEESERGEIHTILRERDICKSNFANVNEYGNRTGYWENFSWEKDTGLVGYRSGYREGADLIEISRCDGGEISGTEKDGKNVSENENITFRVLDGKEISVSRDRLMDTERINNRWSLEETDAMIAPLKGTWTTDTYMGYVLPYNLRKFEPDTYADEEARETFFGEYHEAVRAAEESPVPDISVEVQPVEEYEDGYTIRVNGYESPFSIILSTERINDEYPIYSDTTTLSESFFVEYPVVYIKLFAKFKDGESDRYNPATVIVSADGQVLLLMEGAFYSLERR